MSYCVSFLSCPLLHPPPASTLFPYTTLFRSQYRLLRTDQQFRNALEEYDRIFIDMPVGLEENRYMRECDRILDRKSTRLNSSHVAISYAVFCLKKKIQKLISR